MASSSGAASASAARLRAQELRAGLASSRPPAGSAMRYASPFGPSLVEDATSRMVTEARVELQSLVANVEVESALSEATLQIRELRKVSLTKSN